MSQSCVIGVRSVITSFRFPGSLILLVPSLRTAIIIATITARLLEFPMKEVAGLRLFDISRIHSANRAFYLDHVPMYRKMQA